jgi:RHS repeat-associated protein
MLAAVCASRFTGKERDAESGNDYFGARYYASSMGRWMSPDWADKPEDVPYAKMDDPQSLNLYNYVGNNPLSRADVDGHTWPLLATVGEIVAGGASGAAEGEAEGAAAGPVGAVAGPVLGFLVGAGAAAVDRLAPKLAPVPSSALGTVQIKSGAKADGKSPPNPDGQKGAPDHQRAVEEEADKARAAAGPGETVTQGTKIQVKGSTRRPDVQTVGADGKTKSVVEVERRPNSARNKAREAEYDRLGIEHTTRPLPPKSN